MALGPVQVDKIAEKLFPTYNQPMALLIEVIAGDPLKQLFRIEAGKTIGRGLADIILPDLKISGTHAKFELDNKGQLILVDLNSVNGVIFNGKKVTKVAMMPGVKFQLGKTVLYTREVSAAEADRLAPPLGWKAQLQDFLKKHEPTNRMLELSYFDPLIELEFVKGVQAEDKVLVGYGPRLVGSCTWDIEVKDLSVPEYAFELRVKDHRPLLVNLCGDQLLVNQRTVQSHELASGDLIESGRTLIRINFK